MFPISFYKAHGANWVAQGSGRARYSDLGEAISAAISMNGHCR